MNKIIIKFEYEIFSYNQYTPNIITLYTNDSLIAFDNLLYEIIENFYSKDSISVYLSSKNILTINFKLNNGVNNKKMKFKFKIVDMKINSDYNSIKYNEFKYKSKFYLISLFRKYKKEQCRYISFYIYHHDDDFTSGEFKFDTGINYIDVLLQWRINHL